jgi:hypothetical protein
VDPCGVRSILFDEFNNLVRVVDRAICQQKNVRLLIFFRLWQLEDGFKWRKDLGPTEIRSELANCIKRLFEVLVVILDTALVFKQEFELRPVAYNLKR